MENLDKVHPVLEQIIMDAALKAVDILYIKVIVVFVCSQENSLCVYYIAIHFILGPNPR